VREREDGLGLSLRIGVENVRLDVAFILEQPVEDVDRLPNAAGDEVAEERDVGIGDVVIADAAIASVADMVLGEQVLFVQVPACAVGRSVLA
jgi:hypothetical protein